MGDRVGANSGPDCGADPVTCADPVTYRDGHLQIIACAGAGKTEAISRRVASILGDGVPPEGVIAFTFTEKAGRELKSRIEKKVAEEPRLGAQFLDRLGPMFVGTMHAYCMQMLQRHRPEMADWDVLDDHKLVALLQREYQALDLGGLSGDWKRSENISLFRASVDVVENELLEPQQLGDTPFRASYELFLDMLRRYQTLTYGQMISQAVGALHDGKIRDAVLSPLKHLIVDEYQDTNRAQEALIRELASVGAHLTVVGDDDQAIYQWRGATVRNILEFRERYDAAEHELPLNRRSQPEIVAYAEEFIESSVQERLKKSIKPERSDFGGGVFVWSETLARDEAEKVAETMHALHERGFAWREMAVLLRSVTTSSQAYIEVLEKNGIPYAATGSAGLFLDADAQLYALTYSWLADQKWRGKRWGGTPEDVQIDPLVTQFAMSFGLDSARAGALKKKLSAWYEDAHDDYSEANLVRDFYVMLEQLGVSSWVDSSEPVIVARLGAAARFSNLLADFENATKRARYHQEDGRIRGGIGGGSRFYRRLHDFLQYYSLDKYEGFSGEDSLDYDAVTIATVHASKGLQWPIVFVPALTQRRFGAAKPDRQVYLVPGDLFDRPRYAGSDEDEARLFYVAITRARDGVYVSRFESTDKQSQPPSVFWRHAAQVVGTVSEPPLISPPDDRRAQTESETPIVSFSELAGYDKCPLSFRLRSLVGFQPLLARELGYGKAVHHILRRIGDGVKDGRPVPTGPALDQLIENEFFLPFANKPAYEQMSKAAVKLITGFIRERKADLERVWETERPFELHLEDAIVVGRADVILDADGSGAMEIVDYKTATSDDITIHERQLQIYTSAGRKEGAEVSAALLMDLTKPDRPEPVDIETADIEGAESWAGNAVRGMLDHAYGARPKTDTCTYCDVSTICPHSAE